MRREVKGDIKEDCCVVLVKLPYLKRGYDQKINPTLDHQTSVMPGAKA
jgi:hypothetical protein